MTTGIIPLAASGALAVRDLATGAPLNPPNVQNAYIPAPDYTTSCVYYALPSDCTARITPAQINALVSEMICLSETWSPDYAFNCASLCNLSTAFIAWRDGVGDPSLGFSVATFLCSSPLGLGTGAQDVMFYCDGDGDIFTISVADIAGARTLPIQRNNNIFGVAPTQGEFGTARNGDTAIILLLSGALEFWLRSAGVWGLVYTRKQNTDSFPSVGGTVDAIELTHNAAWGGPMSAYYHGFRTTFLPAGNNTGAVTLNVDGLGSVPVYQEDGTNPLVADALQAGFLTELIYDFSVGGFRLPIWASKASTIPDLPNLTRLLVEPDGTQIFGDSVTVIVSFPVVIKENLSGGSVWNGTSLVIDPADAGTWSFSTTIDLTAPGGITGIAPHKIELNGDAIASYNIGGQSPANFASNLSTTRELVGGDQVRVSVLIDTATGSNATEQLPISRTSFSAVRISK